ncbi:hypothetical protein [Crateriforma conspicua]|uniref:DUF4393 domain-containing protein n=1 Tax=Crateriforma conspicua TaxID=2527996 RepID=A0A5C6FIS2_9PLAN|nr:hypothetical protein [Crateriforma conspicua]TWU59549.1 hypothetical protein V7x_55650 [Crateriforma conspicua]
MSEDKSQTLRSRPVDHVTSVVKGAIGAVPIAGPLLAEIAGTLIPNQRVDRLAKFAERLGERLSDIEDDKLRANLTDENFTDAVEESLRQAARSTSDERRQYIANLLASGINLDNLDFIETKHLLRLLGEINDIEVIWLRAYYGWHWGQRDSAFHERHATILEPAVAYLGSSQDEIDRASMQESYKLHLESLGLLRSRIRFDNKTKLPEFDKNEGFKKSGFEITPLGQLLVRYIDMIPSDAEA